MHNANNNAEEFFDNYIQLSDTFDTAVADLYSDNAKIHAHRKYPHGLEREMELSGKQWKQLLVKFMPLAKAQNDKSIFSQITISTHEKGFKVKATRYSNRKCYTDTGYYMIVEPAANGQLQIIEEYSETQSESNC
jgi:hypothetical protein